jgi:hypothetical protein
MPGLCCQCQSPHLRQDHDHHRYQARPSVRQHDVGLMQVERCLLLHHTWPNWKSHWTTAFAKMCNFNRRTAGDTAFGENQAAELKQVQQMASSLDNLANAAIQKNTTLKNLEATNATLTKAMTNIQLNSPLHECALPASQPLPHQQLPPQ